MPAAVPTSRSSPKLESTFPRRIHLRPGDPTRNRDFVDEQRDGFWLSSDVCRQKLQRDCLIEREILREVHLSHPA